MTFDEFRALLDAAVDQDYSQDGDSYITERTAGNLAQILWHGAHGRPGLRDTAGLCWKMYGVNAMYRCMLASEHEGGCRFYPARYGAVQGPDTDVYAVVSGYVQA